MDSLVLDRPSIEKWILAKYLTSHETASTKLLRKLFLDAINEIDESVRSRIDSLLKTQLFQVVKECYLPPLKNHFQAEFYRYVIKNLSNDEFLQIVDEISQRGEVSTVYLSRIYQLFMKSQEIIIGSVVNKALVGEAVWKPKMIKVLSTTFDT